MEVKPQPQFRQNFAKPMLVALAIAFFLLALIACGPKPGEEQGDYADTAQQQQQQQPPPPPPPTAATAQPPSAQQQPVDAGQIAEDTKRQLFGGTNTVRYIAISILSYKVKPIRGFKEIKVSYTNNTPYEIDMVRLVASSENKQGVCETQEMSFYNIKPGKTVISLKKELNCGQRLLISSYQYDCELKTPSPQEAQIVCEHPD